MDKAADLGFTNTLKPFPYFRRGHRPCHTLLHFRVVQSLCYMSFSSRILIGFKTAVSAGLRCENENCYQMSEEKGKPAKRPLLNKEKGKKGKKKSQGEAKSKTGITTKLSS